MAKRSPRGRKVLVDRNFECAGCGTQYKYRIKVATSHKDDPLAAETEALEHAKVTVADVPCPTCGRLDRYTFLAKRRRHALAFSMPLIMGAIFLLNLGSEHVLHMKGAWVAAGIATAGGIFFTLFLLAGNESNKINHRLSEELVDRGKIHSICETELPRDALDRISPDLFAWLGVWPILAALAAVAMLVALSQLTPDYDPHTTPGYIGPGQKATVELPVEMETVKGYWRGTPSCFVENVDEIGFPITVTGTGSDTIWPASIEKGYPNKFHPRISLSIPADERLAHKTIRLRVRMEVTYPVEIRDRSGRRFYENRTELIDTTTSVRLTDTTTATSLRGLWWAVLGGIALCLVIPPFVLAGVYRSSLRNLPPPRFEIPREESPPC